MNRRDLLKAAGAACALAVVPEVPVLASPVTEPCKLIPWKDVSCFNLLAKGTLKHPVTLTTSWDRLDIYLGDGGVISRGEVKEVTFEPVPPCDPQPDVRIYADRVEVFANGISPVGVTGTAKYMRGWFKTVVRTATCTLPE
jgi:hypothetical protein